MAIELPGISLPSTRAVFREEMPSARSMEQLRAGIGRIAFPLITAIGYGAGCALDLHYQGFENFRLLAAAGISGLGLAARWAGSKYDLQFLKRASDLMLPFGFGLGLSSAGHLSSQMLLPHENAYVNPLAATTVGIGAEFFTQGATMQARLNDYIRHLDAEMRDAEDRDDPDADLTWRNLRTAEEIKDRMSGLSETEIHRNFRYLVGMTCPPPTEEQQRALRITAEFLRDDTRFDPRKIIFIPKDSAVSRIFGFDQSSIVTSASHYSLDYGNGNADDIILVDHQHGEDVFAIMKYLLHEARHGRYNVGGHRLTGTALYPLYTLLNEAGVEKGAAQDFTRLMKGSKELSAEFIEGFIGRNEDVDGAEIGALCSRYSSYSREIRFYDKLVFFLGDEGEQIIDGLLVTGDPEGMSEKLGPLNLTAIARLVDDLYSPLFPFGELHLDVLGDNIGELGKLVKMTYAIDLAKRWIGVNAQQAFDAIGFDPLGDFKYYDFMMSFSTAAAAILPTIAGEDFDYPDICAKYADRAVENLHMKLGMFHINPDEVMSQRISAVEAEFRSFVLGTR